MMILTSIAVLRNSHALQNRVDQVENFLRKNSDLKEWPAAAVFPAEVIRLSNTVDDYEWVLDYHKDYSNRINNGEALVIPGLDHEQTQNILTTANDACSGTTVDNCQIRLEAFEAHLKGINPEHNSIYITPLVNSWATTTEPTLVGKGPDTSGAEEATQEESGQEKMTDLLADDLATRRDGLTTLRSDLVGTLGEMHPAICVADAALYYVGDGPVQNLDETQIKKVRIVVMEATDKLKRTQRK